MAAARLVGVPTGTLAYVPGGLGGLDFHENAWFGGTSDAAGAGDVTADPQLGDITSSSPFDLQPGPSSPLIEAATGAGVGAPAPRQPAAKKDGAEDPIRGRAALGSSPGRSAPRAGNATTNPLSATQDGMNR